MKNRAILTIIISLVTGFLIGFLSSSIISKERARDAYSLSSMKRFKERTYRIIEPTEEQKEDIDPIVEKYASIADSIKQQAYKGFRQMINNYHKELKPHLTKEQMQKLYDFPKHFHKHRKDEKDHHENYKDAGKSKIHEEDTDTVRIEPPHEGI